MCLSTYRTFILKYTGEYATSQISPPDFRPTAQTQQPTVCHTGTGTAVLYARTSTARTMHVWAAPYKMYEAPYILPYMTGNFRPTAQTQKPTVCLNFRPQYKSIVYFRTKVRYYFCIRIVCEFSANSQGVVEWLTTGSELVQKKRRPVH